MLRLGKETVNSHVRLSGCRMSGLSINQGASRRVEILSYTRNVMKSFLHVTHDKLCVIPPLLLAACTKHFSPPNYALEEKRL